ncbi:uncharacterized protein [Rutidosis leptorrhynchoides]|uniref:uncharacterized protein n=1 Tax=Rutidosis leptorrhynchoides TaxID=125765 RepID=UPI003A99A48F
MKMLNFPECWIEKIWGNEGYNYAVKNSTGNSGGILTIWDPKLFIANCVVERDSFILIKGKWKDAGTELIIVNVYGPHTDVAKKKMWEDLSDVMNYDKAMWVLLGDFNEKHKDHCPIMLKEGNVNFGPKPTKVFDEWLHHKEAPDVIKAAWLMELKAEIDELTKSVNNWEIRAETEDLNDSQLKEWMVARDNLIRKEKTELEMLKQKSRFKLALEGDENSKFFHNMIRRRQQKNNIHGVNIAGVWSTYPEDIKKEALVYFSSLFEKKTSEGLELNDWDGPRLDSNMVDKLEARFSEEEIIQAIESCGRNKAPGPDGFNILFYVKFWDVIKADLVNALNWFWENEKISNGCNASFITLIPKVSDPLKFSNYRPISLIGSYYKILSKILANRIRVVIPWLIGKEQSAFLSDRYILDGILTALETLDELKAQAWTQVFGMKYGVVAKRSFSNIPGYIDLNSTKKLRLQTESFGQTAGRILPGNGSRNQGGGRLMISKIWKKL